MNEKYKQWKQILSHRFVLIGLALLLFLAVTVITSFVVNTVMMIHDIATVGSTTGKIDFDTILEKPRLFGQAFRETGWRLALPTIMSETVWIYGIVLLVAGLFFGRKIYNLRISFKDINKGSKGTSRFTTEQEMAEQYRSIPIRGEFKGKAGVPVGINPDREHIYIDDTNTNISVVGGTQTGKTQTISYPTIDINLRASEPDSMIINDIKGDMLRQTYFHPLAQKKFNLRVFNLIQPKNSIRYNPLYAIRKNYFEGDFAQAQKKTQTLSYIFYNNPQAKEPVWDEGAMAVFEAIVFLVTDIAYRYQQPKWVNITAIIDIIDHLASDRDTKGQTTLDRWIMTFPTDHLVRKAYMVATKSEKKQMASFYMMVASKFKYFVTEDIMYLTSDNDLDFASLGYPEDGKPTLLFVVFPYNDESNAKLLKMFFTQIYQELSERATMGTGEFDIRVRSWIEEFQNIPEIDGLTKYLNVGLASGMMFGMLYQSEAGVLKRYGKEDTDSILGAAANSYYIKTDSIEEAEQFSKKLGESTIIGINRSGDPLDVDKSYTEQEESRRLMMADELQHLMQGETIINRTKYTRNLKGEPVRPLPIKNVFKETKTKGGEVSGYEHYTDMLFAYEYLFKSAGGDFDTRDKNLSELELRVNLETDENGKTVEREVKSSDLVIPHDLLDALVKMSTIPSEDSPEFKGWIADEENKDTFDAAKKQLERAEARLRGEDIPQESEQVAEVKATTTKSKPKAKKLTPKEEKLKKNIEDREAQERAKGLQNIGSKEKFKQQLEDEKTLEKNLSKLTMLQDDLTQTLDQFFGERYSDVVALFEETFNGNKRLQLLSKPMITMAKLEAELEKVGENNPRLHQNLINKIQVIIDEVTNK